MIDPYTHIPDAPLEPPAPKVLFYCDGCGEEICEWEYYYDLAGLKFCERCVDAAKKIAEEDR